MGEGHFVSCTLCDGGKKTCKTLCFCAGKKRMCYGQRDIKRVVAIIICISLRRPKRSPHGRHLCSLLLAATLPTSRGSGNRNIQEEELYKDMWILKKNCMYVYYHDRKISIYIYVKYIKHTVFDSIKGISYNCKMMNIVCIFNLLLCILHI